MSKKPFSTSKTPTEPDFASMAPSASASYIPCPGLPDTPSTKSMMPTSGKYSKLPPSSRPSSKSMMPSSNKAASKVPAGTTLKRDEPPAGTKLQRDDAPSPSSRPSSKSMVPSSSKGASIARVGTTLMRDDAPSPRPSSKSMMPSSSKGASKVPAGTKLMRDDSPPPRPPPSTKSIALSASMAGLKLSAGTTLKRDDKPPAGTKLTRDIPAGTKLMRDIPEEEEAPPPPPNPNPIPKSILRTPKDIKMASTQTTISSMSPEEREEQDAWARKQIKIAGVCPEHFEWVRRDGKKGGYQCQGGGHGMLDEQLAEGWGDLVTLPDNDWENVLEAVKYRKIEGEEDLFMRLL